MNTHADKTQENKSQSAANATSQKQSRSTSTFYLEDNRPETVAQLKLQEVIHNSTSQQQTIQRSIYESNGQWYSEFAGGPFRDRTEAAEADIAAGGDGNVIYAPQSSYGYQGGGGGYDYQGGGGGYGYGYQGGYAPSPYGGGYGSQAPQQAGPQVAPPVSKPKSKRLSFVDPSSKEGKQALIHGQQEKEKEKTERAAAKVEDARLEALKPENIELRELVEAIDGTTTIEYDHQYGDKGTANEGHEWRIMKGGDQIGVYHYHPNPAEGGDSSPESIKKRSTAGLPKSYSIPDGFKAKRITDLANQ